MTAGKTATGSMATSPSTSPNVRSRSTTTSATCSPNIPSMSFEEAEMGHCYHHALSWVKKWGGAAEDYLPLHQWFDVIWTVKPNTCPTLPVRLLVRAPARETALEIKGRGRPT